MPKLAAVKDVSSAPSMPLVVWGILDGKQGHEQQTRGLINAMRRLGALDVHYLYTVNRRDAIRQCMPGSIGMRGVLPKPQLVIGAGHRTHLPLLWIARRHAAKAVVLMKPSLPSSWFDLCIVPQHDKIALTDKVLISRGVLNPVQKSRNKSAQSGLLLIGGCCKHYKWDDQFVITQVEQILLKQPSMQWTLSTSRRTPPTFLPALRARGLADLQLVRCEDHPENWLVEQMAQAAQVWVSEDSVSMVYEALSSGAKVGILAVPTKKITKMTRGLRSLATAGWIVRYADWIATGIEPNPPTQFNEAQRCAEIIYQRWFAND